MTRHRGSIGLVLVLAIVGMLVLPGVSMAKSRGSDVSVQQVVQVPADAWESDDTTDTAATLPAVSSHTLHIYDDLDYMVFTVETSGTPYYFETQITGGNDDFDLYMTLYSMDASGVLTGVTGQDDHDWWDAYSEYLCEELDAGTYMLEISSYDDEETGMYDLYWGEGYARRVYGADRYATAIAVSQLMNQQSWVSYDWDFDISGVVIASGSNPADGIAGAPLLGMLDAPLMLSGNMGLSGATAAEIGRVLAPEVAYMGDPLTIYILGSTSAVPGVVEDQLEQIPAVAAGMEEGLVEIVRLEGEDRFGTAAEIAYEYADVYGADTTAYLVNAYAWADSLSVSAPAVFGNRVILPSKVDTVPAETLQVIEDLGITDIVIVGSENVVSADVETDLAAMAGITSVDRVWGADRYETSLEVAMHAVDDLGMYSGAFLLASGENFPDGLCAGGMVYDMSEYGVDAPILLTRKAALSSTVTDFMDTYGQPDDLCYVLGGPAAISDEAVAELNAYRAMLTE